MSERWRAIPGYEGIYEVSDLGNVRSLDRIRACDGRRIKGRTLRPGLVRGGCPAVVLHRGGGRGTGRTRLVGQLVLEAFVGTKPAGLEMLHWNDVPADNRLGNLRWGTRKENAADAMRNGFRPGLVNALKTHCPRGHEYTPENTRLRRGSRECRRCEADRTAAHRRKLAA